MMEFSSSSSSGSSKRAKTPAGNVSVNVSCLVDGCNSDLSQCREYHRRHKVCELHSKTPVVTIAGREQRFCQQCSRFHSLVEFDEGKRSCRKRLDGHNRRRRKPQSDSMPRTSGMFLASQPGTTMLSFNSPQIHPSAVVSSAWAAVVKSENEPTLFNNHPPSVNYIDRHNLFPESSSADKYKGGVNQFQFLQGNDRFLPESSSDHRGGDSGRALSLLSSPPPPTETRDFGSSQMVQPDPVPRPQSVIPELQFSGYPFTQEVDSSGDTTNGTTLQFQRMFDNARDVSSTGGAQQTLSFRWD